MIAPNFAHRSFSDCSRDFMGNSLPADIRALDPVEFFPKRQRRGRASLPEDSGASIRRASSGEEPRGDLPATDRPGLFLLEKLELKGLRECAFQFTLVWQFNKVASVCWYGFD